MIPSHVTIVGQSFTIDRLPGTDPAFSDGPGRWLAGVCYAPSQRIVVSNDLGSDQEADTVLHEVVHGIFRIVGVLEDGDLQEKVVSVLSPLLLNVLRENPELVAYLTQHD